MISLEYHKNKMAILFGKKQCLSRAKQNKIEKVFETFFTIMLVL